MTRFNHPGLLAACLAAWLAPLASQGALTYVDATHSGGSANTGPSTAFHTTNADDNLWGPRGLASTPAQGALGSGGTIYQSGDGNGEDSPEITTTISGLTPSAPYNVYAHFWDGSGPNPDWNLRAGFTSGALTLYANPADAGDIGATAAVLASSLTYATAPTVVVEADRTMYAAPLGIAFTNGAGQLVVYLNDLPSTIGVNNRTWYDGVSFEAAPEPGAAALCLLAACGAWGRRRGSR